MALFRAGGPPPFGAGAKFRRAGAGLVRKRLEVRKGSTNLRVTRGVAGLQMPTSFNASETLRPSCTMDMRARVMPRGLGCWMTLRP